jgi:uncharacterized protein (TIGR03067 family)
MNLYEFLVLTAGLLACSGGAQGPAAQQDMRQLEGIWKVVAAETDGKKVPPEDLGRYQLLIESGGRMTAFRDGKITLQGSMTLDPARMPKTLDVTFTQGEQSGKTAQGIYELKDGTFKVCRASPGHNRPTEFASPPGSGLTLIVYERAKPR